MWVKCKKFCAEVPPVVWTLLLILLLIAASIWQELPGFFQVNGATGYFAALFQTITGWQLTTIVIALLLLSTPAIRRLIDGINSLDFKGLSLKVGERSRDTLQSKFEVISGVIKDYRENVSGRIRQMVSEAKLQSALTTLNGKLKTAFPLKDFPIGYRCTIHIPDPVFESELYQLLEYFTPGGNSEGDAGRSRPIGYGIIGRVWRSKLNDLRGKLFPDTTVLGPDGTALTEVQRISLEWGMSLDDAKKVLEHPSYLCCLIEYGGERVGILYADATVSNAFTSEDNKAEGAKALLGTVVKAISDVGIPKLLWDLEVKLAKVSPKIEIGS